ncbi:MAG: hypothetical protein ACI3XO_10310 [Eubacteriales bacterium]
MFANSMATSAMAAGYLDTFAIPGGSLFVGVISKKNGRETVPMPKT